MPQLRSPIPALQYALERARIKQGYWGMLQQGVGQLAQRSADSKARGERNTIDENQHADRMALENERYITETNRADAREARLTKGDADAQAYRDTLQAQHKQERMEDISRDRGSDLAAEARHAQGFAEEQRQFEERERRLSKEAQDDSMARGAGNFMGGLGKLTSGVSDWRKESARQEEKGREEDRANARIMLSATQQERTAYESQTKGYESLLERHEKRLKALADAGDSDLIRTLTPEFRAKLKEQYGDRLTDPKLAALVKALDARDRLEQVIEHRRTSGPGVATYEPMAEPGPAEEDELSGFEAEFESAGG